MRRRRLARLALTVGLALAAGQPAAAGLIDTRAIEAPWPKQRMSELEVGRHPVVWRQRASKKDGIFAGATFQAPTAHAVVWKLATDYHDVGTMTPGVTAVTILEQTPTRHVAQIDVRVLWRSLRLRFEIEQDPPRAVRFRVTNPIVGEYSGALLMRPAGDAATDLELVTRLRPGVPVPLGLMLSVERVVLLRGIRNFLDTCEQAARAAAVEEVSASATTT